MPRSTSKSRRSSSTPASAIRSLTRTRWASSATPALCHGFGGLARFGEDALRRPRSAARLDRVAELAEGHLEAGEGDDDVEGAVVAAVGDPHDASLQVPLAARHGDAVVVAHQLRGLGALDRVRQ